MWHSAMTSRNAGNLAVFFLVTVIGGNIAYVWLKKEPQYIERAASTRQLILALNDPSLRLGIDKTLCIEHFPLDPWVGTEATRWFSSVPPANVVFSNACQNDVNSEVVRWNDSQGLTYIQSSIGRNPLEESPGN